MPVTEAAGMAGKKLWQRRDRREKLGLWLVWLVCVSIAVVCWQYISNQTIWMFVLDAPMQAFDMASRMSNPRWAYFQTTLKPLWDTINIATLGTILGIVVATPIAFLAAHNTTPSRYFVRPIALAIIVSSRSINSLI